VSAGSSDRSAAARRRLVPRCSGFAREDGLDPAGSAGSYQGFALVEIPLAWPRRSGGHRFAPTALLLPEGTLWAYLDLDLLVGVSDRSLDVDEAVRLYRGCAGLDCPEELRVSGFAAA